MTSTKSIAVFSILTLSLSAAALFAHAARGETRDPGGHIEAKINGRTFRFPILNSDITADIQGDLATVTVVQTFANPVQMAVNATYLFPLSKDAAVYAMKMEVGDERVTAIIKKKQEARATFEKAKRQGKAAALLTQTRPNMFTQELANLMPGKPVTITMRYTQTVPRIDGAYELVVPLIVGPRYQPAQKPSAKFVRFDERGRPADDRGKEQTAISVGTSQPGGNTGIWEFQKPPKYPEVSGLTIPDQINSDRVSITVNLRSALSINSVASTTHAIATSTDGLDALDPKSAALSDDIYQAATRRTIKLAKGRIIDNRDFVLRYQLGGAATNAGLLAHKDQRGGFFSLMIEPPKAPAPDTIVARELVFILDTSGSMSGEPMDASKTFMRHALAGLRTKDYFRIVRFGSTASEFSSRPVPATSGNIQAGQSFINGLRASGGTEVLSAIDQAFSVRQTPGTMRIVVFLSDGYIGNESQVLNRIAAVVGKARIYAFGVGTSVNRFLLSEMARKARGFARYIDPTEKSNDVAMALAARIESPVLTNISIDWGDLAPKQVTPAIIPDLFKGGSIRVQGRFTRSGTHNIAIVGMVNGAKARLPLQISLPATDTGDDGAAIPLIWARSQIADAMRELTTPSSLRASGLDNKALEEAVTKLGLTFSLATQWTSFVAVSTKIVNADPAAAINRSVPLPMVKGVTPLAYPKQQRAGMPRGRATFKRTSTRRFAFNFSGSSAPEPGIIGGFGVLALVGLLARRRRRRKLQAA